MENNRNTANGAVGKQPKSTRRVGTFTLGVTLIACGVLLLARIFFPALDILWLMQFAPVVLILLGIEMLLRAARTDEKLNYDWLSILVCFVLLCGAAVAAAVPAAAYYYRENTGVYAEMQPQAYGTLAQTAESAAATPEDSASAM